MSFHVPELSRLLSGRLGSDRNSGNNGGFELESPEPGWSLFLIASDGSEFPDEALFQWEHVSVHAYQHGAKKLRTPTWKEMAYVKRLCWDGEDVVVQYHPRKSEYVNCHPNVLHLWRPKLCEIPTPPTILVGPTNESSDD